LCPKLLKGLLRVWSAECGQESCLLAFATIRLLASEMPPPFLEHTLKGLYLTYARSCRSTSRSTLSRVVLMSSCVVDVCAMDTQVTYQHGFVYIRQLAIHLRNALQKADDASYRQVYNWQYINCLRVWAQVLCAHGKDPNSVLRHLLYPLVQVCLGVARLLPNIRFAALRFQCVRILSQLSSELGVFVPVAPLLLEVFQFSQLARSPAAQSKERPIDWAVLIKVTKADAEKRRYQEGMMAQALFLLSDHLHANSYSIAFPEAAVPTLISLKKLAKKTKITSLQQRARKLMQQVEAQADWVRRARDAVDFGPGDGSKVSGFLSAEREKGSGPFSKWFKQELAAVEAAEAGWREQAEAQGRRIEPDEDDDEEELAQGKRRKKKKPKPQAEKLPQARGDASKGRGSLDVGADHVEELRMSDISDDED